MLCDHSQYLTVYKGALQLFLKASQPIREAVMNKPFVGHGKLRWIGRFFGFICLLVLLVLRLHEFIGKKMQEV